VTVRELFQEMEGQTQRNSATDSIVWMEEDEPACCIVEKPWRYEFSRAFYWFCQKFYENTDGDEVK